MELYKEIILDKINGKENKSVLIDKYLIPTQNEKKKYVEVSTPYKLRQEMLDKIPVKFWSTPKKVFEPCCGKGGFLIDIIDRFMMGLKKAIPDEKIRYKSIVEECLYFSDINSTNIFICKLLIDPCNEYKLNYNEGDTLKLDTKEKWNIEGFDAVIGNPPYNLYGATNTGNTMWQHFTKASLNIFLKADGYLLYVHPPGWRKPNNKRSTLYGLYKLMAVENQMLYLSIHGLKDGEQTFNCGTRYDWYLIQKKPNNTKTIINDEKGNRLIIDMNNFEWIPNYNIDMIEKILAKGNEEKCPVIRSSISHQSKWVSKIKTDEFKYPCIYSTPIKGIRYMYSNINDKGHFGVSKVIFSESGMNNPIIDMKGHYGMTHNAIGIKVDNQKEANDLINALTSKKMKILIDSCSYSLFRIEWVLFTYLKKDFWKDYL